MSADSQSRFIAVTMSSDRRIINTHIKYILNIDKEDMGIAHFLPGSFPSEEDHDFPPPPPPKKRRRNTRKVTITPEHLAHRLGLLQLPNNHSSRISLFSSYTEKILSRIGTIIWRQHTINKDVFILNDYDIETGNFIPNSFVHVTHLHHPSQSPESLIKCTCNTYKYLSGCVANNTGEDEDILLEQESLTCMHCRFIQHHYTNITNPTKAATSLQTKLSSTLHLRNSPVIQVGHCNKFSVIPSVEADFSDECQFVHISEDGQYILCKSSLCATLMQTKKKIKKFDQLPDFSFLCGHLQTAHANIEFLQTRISSLSDQGTPTPITGENVDDQDLYSSEVCVCFKNLTETYSG